MLHGLTEKLSRARTCYVLEQLCEAGENSAVWRRMQRVLGRNGLGFVTLCQFA